MIIREGSRITKISLMEIETQEEIRRRLEKLTSANSAHFETLKNILDGNKLVVLKFGDIEVEIVDGSIGDDLKNNDTVGVHIHGTDKLEKYKVSPWGLGELFAYPYDSLITGIKDINRGIDNLTFIWLSRVVL